MFCTFKKSFKKLVMNTNEQIKWLEKQVKLYLNDLEDYGDPFELEEQLPRQQALKEFIDFVKEVH
jgi:hypothetical protein